MKSRRSTLLFWILLLVSAVIVSIYAFKLLLHEQERINNSAEALLIDRAQAIAQDIHFIVEEVEQSLSKAMLDIDSDNLEPTLLLWEETNPLVRNVFIWKEKTLLKYPVQGMASTLEERQFVNRFDSFFSGERSFISDKDSAFSESAFQQQSSKQTLYDLARGKTQTSLPAVRSAERALSDSFIPESGWIPWFAQDQLFILGWVKQKENGPIFGIELELVSLLSRLIVDLPYKNDKELSFAVLDSRNQILHLSGDIPLEQAMACDSKVSLSNLLPHWQLCVYPGKDNNSDSRGFLYLSVLLLFIFMTALVSAGLLITAQAKKHMKDAMQKTSFVSSVSHELKTPLTSIRMYAELMLEKRSVSEEKTKHYLEVMVAQSQRLTRLINNILDFGRLEQGNKKYNKEQVDIREILTKIIDSHNIRIKNAGFEIKIDISQGNYTAVSDPDALEQVVLNLIDNALKYAKDGKLISFGLYNDSKGFILLKISDNGPGIEKKHQEAIFEKFYRIDNSLTSTFPGSGLGLSIARQILRDLGGGLEFEPVIGNGSCFIVRIPENEL